MHPIKRTFTLFVLSLVLAFVGGCESGEPPETEADGQADDAGVELTEVWRLEEGLDRPESVIYDGDRDVLYVSNLVGGGDEMDGVGYISRVSLDGEMTEQDWVDGLNAPKGLALGDGRLYAADVDALLEIDLDSGEIVDRHGVEGDVYLNDVTVGPDGSVYVSDSRYSKIYTLGEAGLDIWLEDANIQMPNGVHVVEDRLYVAAGDTSSEEPGSARFLQSVALGDQSIQPLADREPVGALDAVEPDGQGGLFVTDWGNGRLMHFDGSELVELRQLGQGAADAEYVADERMLYVPVMMEGQLIAYEVTR